ncbi:GlsB/YeaQ/YmgE family stress response membrane protein [Bradyrhizobium sp. ISRA443]|uniref:GlsB/YeaQ/YmgE family stress response membrane protein n=1 Tax=unclassified Bradyrhizobium TaxID=2631580 RepID=UPI0024784859|nr:MULTISPECIES: GlsB/YeaQ/YmgE family stress response membrane protein [unclassified Bradyrhizobium]WGR93845.1 GlsB/YeaQ/YmgE family stress response membrane protein [Bradyrhizobium sp. ISRA435]WGR98459.1 GlsB/YeaQ/YmgE family stress response membrane protein [Bradyrhizobium sp. ISRA436]WGS05348.1 GlsB/YeaQ/YmgE family stress response membrane protein [Bradyrhizobium sp. ISRA437]WGS12234.1 GlsB/YeaQ/YmgE family stress response membrane protein [Bradyrhizobium sp. ISRA443]
MYISGEGLIVILLAGLVAGWLAGKIVAGGGFGLIGDVAVGIVGALIGTWLLPRLGIHIGSGFVSTVVVATIGAIVLLLIIGLLGGKFPRRRWGLSWRRWRL